jgi:malonate-semialdehyde dehydrogenase (acetylating)/methylmalonate-semialdehyde dehydrogenase
VVEKIGDYIGGQWQDAGASDHLEVTNPATAAVIGKVMLTPREVVARAAETGHQAFLDWRRVPVTERVQPLFKLKRLMEEHLDELARFVTN